MTETHVKNVIEAALLAAGRPLQITELAQLFEEHVRPDASALKVALDALTSDYEGRGIEIKETATGFRVQVRKELAPEISRLWPERPPRYSRALLETLALIAYRQPITRAEIEAVRGVAVNPNIIKTLLERNWVRVVGHRDVPGRPELLSTTREFLDYFSLRSLDELPPLAELKVMTDPNLQLALSAATPAAAAAVEGLSEGIAATESTAAEAGEASASGADEAASLVAEAQSHTADEQPQTAESVEPEEPVPAVEGLDAESTEAIMSEAEITAAGDAKADDSDADDEESEVAEAELAESDVSDGDDDDTNVRSAQSPDDEADLKLAEEEDEKDANREGGDSAELVASRRDFDE